MKTLFRYDSFPRSIVFYRAFLLIALIGVSIAAVMFGTLWGGGLYVLYVLAVLGLQMTTACARCDYYHGRCDSGLSVVTRLLVKKKSDRPGFLGAAKICGYPIIAMVLIPLGTCVVMIILKKSVLHAALLAAIAVIFLLIVITNTRVACPHCRMNDICPLGKSVVSRRGG